MIGRWPNLQTMMRLPSLRQLLALCSRPSSHRLSTFTSHLPFWYIALRSLLELLSIGQRTKLLIVLFPSLLQIILLVLLDPLFTLLEYLLQFFLCYKSCCWPSPFDSHHSLSSHTDVGPEPHVNLPSHTYK